MCHYTVLHLLATEAQFLFPGKEKYDLNQGHSNLNTQEEEKSPTNEPLRKQDVTSSSRVGHDQLRL